MKGIGCFVWDTPEMVQADINKKLYSEVSNMMNNNDIPNCPVIRRYRVLLRYANLNCPFFSMVTESVQSLLREEQIQLQVHLRHAVLRSRQERLLPHQWSKPICSTNPKIPNKDLLFKCLNWIYFAVWFHKKKKEVIVHDKACFCSIFMDLSGILKFEGKNYEGNLIY